MAASCRLRSLLVVVLLGATAVTSAPPALASAPSEPASARESSATRPRAPQSGLEVTIDSITPSTLQPGEPLQLTGVVSNHGKHGWPDAQVYLDIGQLPATTQEELTAFAATEEVFGSRIVAYGQFDEIGNVPVGSSKSYSLSVPYGQLPISGDPGVYHVGVSVLAGVGENRDQDADARSNTLIPLVPSAESDVAPAPMVTMIPFIGSVALDSEGTFLDDVLAKEVGLDGRLRNLLDFALQAPGNTLQVVLDPALYDAVLTMSQGYSVRRSLNRESVEGSGQDSANQWLLDLDTLLTRQPVVLLPWGTPVASQLAANRLSTVVRGAVETSWRYEDFPHETEVVGMQAGAIASRRGLSLLRSGGTTMQLVSEACLPKLDEVDSPQQPPAAITVEAGSGPLTAVVVRDDIAGERVAPDTSPLVIRQLIMAESVVDSLSGRLSPTTISLPFYWNPGPDSGAVSLVEALSIPTLAPKSLSDAAVQTGVPYEARIRPPDNAPVLTEEQLDLIRQQRHASRTYVAILDDAIEAEGTLSGQVALSGSASWTFRPIRGSVLAGREIRLLRKQLAQVTVVAPTFVALSSGSGPFPVTVTNGLDVPITVRLSVVPLNPALKVDAVDELQLAPGQVRDLQVRAHSEGSGLTPVRIHLATPEDRRFGRPWEVDVRATQIGLAIWIVMGIGLAVLVGAALVRIIRRFRSPGGFTPREEPRHP